MIALAPLRLVNEKPSTIAATAIGALGLLISIICTALSLKDATKA